MLIYKMFSIRATFHTKEINLFLTKNPKPLHFNDLGN